MMHLGNTRSKQVVRQMLLTECRLLLAVAALHTVFKFVC